MNKLLTIVLVLLSAPVIVWTGCDNEVDRNISATISVAEALQGDTTGYERARRPADIRFPEDHGPHPDFKTEWWYFTGNVSDRVGRPFGYQFTIFRTAVLPPDQQRDRSSSQWSAGQLYTAHVAVTDPAGERFLFEERFSRQALGLAGSQPSPFRVWVENWLVEQNGEEPLMACVKADADEYGISLQIRPTKMPVLHGENGFSPTSPDVDNASYYYSFTRLETSGVIRIGDRRFEVSGNSWMDHEWSTSALGPTQVGWDWFSLQLSNGVDIMYFQVRAKDTLPPFVEGTLVDSLGRSHRLNSDEIGFGVIGSWRSVTTNATYPAGWNLQIPQDSLAIAIVPILKDQELTLAVHYWEGAVSVKGVHRGKPVTGSGYVELTGYGDPGHESLPQM